jgi:WD40 repeat protein
MIHINKLLLFFVFLSITTAEAQKTTLPISILKGHTDLITSLEFSSDGRILASLSDDGTTNLWNISDRSLIKTFSRVSLHMALSPDGKTLATDPSEYKQADLDKGIFNPTQTITFWSVNDGSLIRKLEIDKTIYSMTFSPDGSILAGAIGDGTVKLWNVKNGGLIRTINTGDDLELSVAFSPDGKILASGGIGKEKIVRLWKVDDGALIRISTRNSF